jgi:low affinity Fe/Cu permease
LINIFLGTRHSLHGKDEALTYEREDTGQTLRSAISAVAHKSVDAAASAWAVAASVVATLAWVVVGFAFGFTHWWMDVLVVVTSLITFVMVFLIQHKTGQQSRALMLKLDELIRANGDARNDLIAAEHRSLDEQEELEEIVREDHPAAARPSRTPRM